MTTYDNVISNLENLNLIKIRSMLPEYLDSVSKKQTSLLEALNTLTTAELADIDIRVSENLIKTAAFPYRKTIEDFDFDFNDSINKNQILDLMSLRFMNNHRNVIFVGSPGVR